MSGLADVRCLGSMSNHSSKRNAIYKTLDYSSRQAILDPTAVSDVSVGGCVVLIATRDIEKDEQILCNYEPSSAKGMDIPFAHVSLLQFMKICYRSVRKSQREARWLNFF
jgi:hypothetical protein